MSRLRLVEQTTAPETPGTGQVVVYANTDGELCAKNDAGTVRASPGLGVANVFTAVQTFTLGINTGDLNLRPHVSDNNFSLDIAEGATVTLTNTQEMDMSSNSVFSGLVLIANGTDGQAALFLCSGTFVVEIADTQTKYSNAKGTETSTNLYYSAVANKYILENFTGGSRTYSIFSIRLRATS